jgi:hypothetical protein
MRNQIAFIAFSAALFLAACGQQPQGPKGKA